MSLLADRTTLTFFEANSPGKILKNSQEFFFLTSFPDIFNPTSYFKISYIATG